MVSEENLSAVALSGAAMWWQHPKSMLKKFEQELLEQNWAK